MKRVFTIASLAFFLVGCEKPKDYSCVCIITEESMFGGQPKTTEQTYIIHAKKRKAVKECDTHEPDGVQVWTKTNCAVK